MELFLALWGMFSLFLTPVSQSPELYLVEPVDDLPDEIMLKNVDDRQQFNWSAYREGTTVYSTYYSESEPLVLFTDIDVATFQPEDQLTTQRAYGPIASGGFTPHWYTDKNYLYCNVGNKGEPNPVRIARPVELLFIPLIPAFDPTDGFSELENSAWQERATGEYGQLFWQQSETGQRYNAMDCLLASG